MTQFTDEQLLAIRKDPRTSAEVAQELGICDSRVRQLRSKKLTPQGPWPRGRPVKRWRGGVPGQPGKRGEESHFALLTDDSVRWLRGQRRMRPDAPYWQLAEDVAVRFRLDHVPCERTIGLAINGKTWGHL